MTSPRRRDEPRTTPTTRKLFPLRCDQGAPEATLAHQMREGLGGCGQAQAA